MNEVGWDSASAMVIIPARGGSKAIPGKNLARIGGIPLVARAVRTALRVHSVDRVVVTTDDPSIAAEARTAGAEVIDRPAELSTDSSSSEAALLHALAAIGAVGPLPPVLVFVQATSPFIDPADLAAAIERVRSGECDVVFSATPSHRFLWKADGPSLVGVNHAHTVRLRRQDREPEFLETGAFYVMSTEGFRAARNRFFGRIGAHPVDPRGAIEIDDPEDLELARALSRVLPIGSSPDSAPDVDALVMDFDGVHTDNSALIDATGDELVRVNRSDGLGIELLRAVGVPMVILSTERHAVVTARAAKLGLDCIHGLADKASALVRWAQQHGIDLARVAYLGNDLNDLGCLRRVGWPVVVADAHPSLLDEARLVLTRAGGHGAVRELADLILAHRASSATTSSLIQENA